MPRDSLNRLGFWFHPLPYGRGSVLRLGGVVSTVTSQMFFVIVGFFLVITV